MSDLNDRFAYERLVRRIDDPSNKAVVVILINDDDTIDSATVGIDNALGLWSILFSMTAHLSEEVMAGFSDEQKLAARIVVPSLEQARDMGILKSLTPRNGKHQ